MPTVYTHGVFGLGLGTLFTGRRLPWLFWLLAALLPMLPDADTFFNIPYGSLAGHRGFTHSLLFALVVALPAAGLTYRPFKVHFLDLWGFFFVIIASHGILDAFTNGGYGIPLFWPFSDTRFGPWRGGPIKVADIGFELPDPWTSRSLQSEIQWIWLPLAVLVGLVVLYRGIRAWRRRRVTWATSISAPGLPRGETKVSLPRPDAPPQ